MVTAGTLVVRTAQPLGNLAVYLLEPRSEDGLATWNFFDEGLKDRRAISRSSRLPQAAPISSRAGRAARRGPRAAAADHVRPGRRRRAAARRRRRLRRPPALARRRALAAGPRRPAAESARRDRPLAAVRRRQGAGQGPRPHSLARRRYGPIDRRQDVVRHGPGPPRLPVRARPGPLLRHVRRLARRSG